MEELQKFLCKQRMLQIAPKSEEPWIANVFMGSDTPNRIYFIGGQSERYSKLLIENTVVAFATAWYEQGNHTNRKGVQGVGVATLANSEEEITRGVELHNKNYPEFKGRITVDWIKSSDNESSVWVIDANYIKFWNDELYGLNGTKEFKFN